MSNSESDTGLAHLANVYAKALLGAAETAGQTEQVLEELEAVVRDVLDRLPRLEAVLASPRVEQADKLSLLDRALGGKASPVLLNALKVMVRHGRFDCLRATQKAARHAYNELRGRREAFVRTAEPIGPELVEAIAARLRTALKADVDVRLTVDPSLIGGLVVRVGDTVYDGSVANQLSRFREEALERATQEMRGAIDRFLAPA